MLPTNQYNRKQQNGKSRIFYKNKNFVHFIEKKDFPLKNLDYNDENNLIHLLVSNSL